MVEAREIPALEFERMVRSFQDPLFRSLAEYECWKQEMGILWAFWAGGEERLALLGVEADGGLVGVARVLRVPFRERKEWGRKERERGEVQDIFLRSPDLLRPVLEKARELLEAHGLEVFGVSAWEPAQFESATPEQRPLLRRIQESSWGFFIPPDFGKQEVLIAWLKEQAVGSVYLNRAAGHLDFGVQVVRDLWRQRVGTALLEAAQRRCREWGFPRMMVTRVLRALPHIDPADRQALDFYLSCGGVLLREYRGFRRKKRPRRLNIPPLKR
ncbi:MAG: GNAT family N-acetyltransferase [Anaerolineae bacterium]